MSFRILLLVMTLSVSAFAQAPPIEPGVSQELAKWRAVRYSDVRYKLNLTLEKMSPVLKGTIEEPGKDPALFRDGSELMAVLEALASQVGNGLGSTSSSPILET